MHELGVAFYVVRDVKEVMVKNNVNKVNSVTLEIGEVSGVVPDLLTDVWDWAVKKEPMLTGTALKIETIKAVTFCEDCKKEYGTVEHGRTCPNCGSENTYLLYGNEFNLKEIEVPDDEDS